MSEEEPTNAAYLDEAYHNKGRFRSVSILSTGNENAKRLERKVKNILESHSIDEFKWSKTSSERYLEAGKEIINLILEEASKDRLRIDTLRWDTTDERHDVRPRDDVKNLSMMYYKLADNVFTLRWGNDCSWGLHFDKQTALDFDEWKRILESSSTTEYIEEKENSLESKLRRHYDVFFVEECNSAKEILCQIADLFAGISVFSRKKVNKYRRWENKPLDSFLGNEEQRNFSNSELHRFPLLKKICNKGKDLTPKIPYLTKKGLDTPNPECPINFWEYKPQVPEDEAPTKGD